MTDSYYIDTSTRPFRVRGGFQDNQSWQRNDLGTGGRYSGRDYYDRRSNPPEMDRLRSVTARDAGRALRVGGLVLIAAGAAGWVWLILQFVAAVGAGTIPDDPFGTQVSGIPLGSGALVAIVAGSLLATIGSWAARAAQDRRERSRLGVDQAYWR